MIPQFLFGSLLAIVVIALGVAFGILLAKRLEILFGEHALSTAFWKPLRAVLLGIAIFVVAGGTYIYWISR
jgi:hypothetical protein